VARPTSQKQNLDKISHSNVLLVFKVCLELPSGSKEQFGFVVGECSKPEHAILATELAILLHA